MEVITYEVDAVKGWLEESHGFKAPQKIVYIPGKAVIGYGFKEQEKIDFLLPVNKESLEFEESLANGSCSEARNLKRVDIPDSLAEELISISIKLEDAKKEMQEKGSSLIKLLEQKK